MENLNTDGKMLKVFSEKGLQYFNRVNSIVKQLIDPKNPKKAKEVEDELIKMGYSERAARQMIIHARSLLQKNIKTSQRDVNMTNNERYEKIIKDALEMRFFEVAQMAMEQQEMEAGLLAKNKITQINNTLTVDYSFEPTRLEKQEQEEMAALIRKSYILTKANG